MPLPRIGGFSAPPGADFAKLNYTGSNLTSVQYYNGGSASGELLGTLQLAYSGSVLISVGWL